jgi:AraC-like DNA-binding protein
MTTQDLRIETGLAEMASLIARFAAVEGVNATPLPQLSLSRASRPSERVHGSFDPCVCVIAQGAKRVMLADEVYRYDRATFIVATVDLPISGQVIEATDAKPYLGVKISIDPREVAALLVEADMPSVADPAPRRGLFVSRVGPDMLEACVRLLRLLETPEDLPALAPLALREILYRLLKSEEGARLRQAASANGRARRIARAVEWLKGHFVEPLRVEDLAAQASMSASSFHEHFRAVTAMSPLQFQKQLRLQEARRLLMAEALDAASAGHRVGYESPSQFSREYSRLFGAPPAADMRRMRSVAPATPAHA